MTAAAAQITRFDAAADRFFDRLRGRPKCDRIMYAASELGDHSLIWLIAATTTAVLGDEAAKRRALRLAVGLGIESALVNGPIKSLFRRERPTSAPTERPHRLRNPRTSSFPSGHASGAVVAYGMLAYVLVKTLPSRWHQPVVMVATALAFSVGWSRIFIEVHFASDVLAAFASGTAWLTLVIVVTECWLLGSKPTQRGARVGDTVPGWQRPSR